MFSKFCKVFTVIFILNAPVVLSVIEQSIFDDDDILSFPSIPDLTKPPTGITLPGTKWCGPGDIASDSGDLGFWEETDACCRDHDNCPNILEAGETKNGLKNSDLFTRLHCDCEQKFLNCLQKGKKVSSIAIGKVYFGFRKYCFREDYPIVKCAKYHFDFGLVKMRCVRYVLDDSQPKTWQWFNNPFFTF